MPYWKHPYPSEIPFEYHNELLYLLVYFSKYIAIPISLLIGGYLIYAREITNVRKVNLILILLGIPLYLLMEIVDPSNLFIWWLD